MERAKSGERLLAVYAALKAAGADSPARAQGADKMVGVGGLTEKDASSVLAYLVANRRCCAREWRGHRYVYWITAELPPLRAMSRRVHRTRAAVHDPVAAYTLRIDGPDTVIERKVGGGMVARIMALMMEG